MIAFHGGSSLAFFETLASKYGADGIRICFSLLFAGWMDGWMDNMKDLGPAICLRDTFVGTR